MLKLQIGDRVFISEYGKDTYPNESTNPRNTEGSVVQAYPSEEWTPYTFCIDVRWDNGELNCYRSVDLELINNIVENE